MHQDAVCAASAIGPMLERNRCWRVENVQLSFGGECTLWLACLFMRKPARLHQL